MGPKQDRVEKIWKKPPQLTMLWYLLGQWIGFRRYILMKMDYTNPKGRMRLITMKMDIKH